MKLIALCMVVAFSVSGCADLSTFTSKGKKTTVFYDDEGRQTKAVSKDINTSDVSSHYKAIESVADSVQVSVKAKVDAIKSVGTAQAKQARTATESALLGVLTMQAIGDVSVAQVFKAAIDAIGDRPMTGIEGLSHGLDTAAKVVTVGVVGKYTADILGKFADAAGTRIANNIKGDGNSVDISTKKVAVTTTTHNNSTGDNSPPVTNNNQTANGCKGGDCAPTDTTTDGTDLGMCTLADGSEVPIVTTDSDGVGFVNSSGCSCTSAQAGHCEP